MSDAAKNIAMAKDLKEQGNTAFKEGEYQKAIAAYHQIFMYVHGYSQGSGGGGSSMGMPGQTTTPVTAEEMAQIRELKLAHFCNLAMCHMKHGQKYVKARDCCTKALALDADNVKALFRRGKCHAALNAIDEAKEDLDRVIELQPDNKDAVRELRALRGAFEKQRKKEQRKFAGMFERLQDEEQAEPSSAAGEEPFGLPSVPPPPAPAAMSAALGDAAAHGEDIVGTRVGDLQSFEPKGARTHGARERTPTRAHAHARAHARAPAPERRAAPACSRLVRSLWTPLTVPLLEFLLGSRADVHDGHGNKPE